MHLQRGLDAEGTVVWNMTSLLKEVEDWWDSENILTTSATKSIEQKGCSVWQGCYFVSTHLFLIQAGKCMEYGNGGGEESTKVCLTQPKS